MDGSQAIATFPGVERIIGGTLTWGHGEAPGVCVLQIAPQPNPPQLIGDLKIRYGNAYIFFNDCRIVDASYRRDSSGQIVSLTIEDWRWQWRDRGMISGRYNQRNADGTLIEHTEKSPQALARLCFEAMGQGKFDVSQLPDDARPAIEWDVATPAQALSNLCELLGCRIAPGFWNVARIVKLGEGQELPDPASNGATEVSDILDPPERPDAIIVVGGPAEFQMDFELEAVALEADGNYSALDEVSYKPASGWTYNARDEFSNISDLKSQELAKASVYRSYRIIARGSEGLQIPGYEGGVVSRYDQLVFLNRQCVQVEELGEKTFLPAFVYGAFEGTRNFGDDAFENTVDEPEPITDLESDLAKKCIVQGGFSLNDKKGVLTLSTPLVLQDNDDKTLKPAQLRLRMAVNLRDEKTGGLLRHTKERRYTKDKTKKPKVIRRDEIVARSIANYRAGSTSFEVEEVTNNLDQIDKEADYYLDIEEKQYRDLTPSEASYGHILSLEPDGAINHIVWKWGNSAAATTMIGRNTELKNYITPYKERRQAAKIKEQLASFPLVLK